MFNRSNKSVEKTLSDAQSDMMYATYVTKMEQVETERLFARLFSSEDGKKALAYLLAITFQRALGATAPDEHLRYMEGQRSMVATILRLIDRGRRG